MHPHVCVGDCLSISAASGDGMAELYDVIKVCMYVCMWIGMYVCMFVCMSEVYVYVCMCMNVCRYLCM